MKTITTRQYATVKRVAQNVNPLVVKKNKFISKINDLTEEIAQLNNEIEGHEMGIKSLTGGYTSEDLITKRVEDSGKVDKDGKPIKITKYEPTDGVLVFNEETKLYEIHEQVNNYYIKGDNIESISGVEVNTVEE